MKKTFFILIFFAVISIAAQAQQVCASFFEEVQIEDANTNTSSHTSNFKARYFSVSKYKNLFKKSELGRVLKKIKNLQQFVENLPEIDSLIENSAHNYFVANELVPIIDSFLKDHGVVFEKIIYGEDTQERSTYFVITAYDSEHAPAHMNTLNELATKIAKEKVKLLIDPLALFFEHSSIQETEGHVEAVDSGYARGYVMSLHLLLESQSKDFAGDDYSQDEELYPIVYGKEKFSAPETNKKGTPAWMPSEYH